MTVLGVAMMATALGGAGTASAQMGSMNMSAMKDAQVADLQTMKDKFTRLGNEFTEAQFDWRPMEGVRSVKDVLVLMASEGNLFPTMWGAPAPMGAGADFRAEVERLGALSKADLLAEVGKAFDNIIGAAKGMDDAARMKPVKFFGRDTNAGGAIFMAQSDMHEHLGQLIAYARTNHIVPPWSRGNGM
jgi:hypothetical protein